MNLDLGGIVFGFKPADGGLELSVNVAYHSFISAEKPEVTIIVKNGPPPLLDLAEPRLGGAVWAYFETKAGKVLQSSTRIRGLFPRKDTLIYNERSNEAVLYVELNLAAAYPDGRGLEIPPFIIDELMVTAYLAQRKGLHIHACGLDAWEGRGFLFSGYSGAGKSTMGRIWQESGAARLFSDERVGVRSFAGVYRLYGTPWHSTALNASLLGWVPLQRMFILQHASKNKARRLRPAEAVAALAARAYLPFWDEKAMAQVLEFLDGLVQAVPCYELGFVPNAGVIDFIQCLID